MLTEIIVAIAVGAALAVACFRWHLLVYGLLIYITVGGAIQLWLLDVRWAVLLKDIVFVIPIYIGLFFLKGRRRAKLPAYLVLTVTLFVAVVLVEMLNFSAPPWLARLIGLRVWLFYLPMILVGSLLGRSLERVQTTLRIFVVAMWLPCVVGIVQWGLSLIIGYQKAISLFYGLAGASVATQGFTTFGIGIGGAHLMRIPATFSFPTQYYNYLICGVTIAWIAAEGERNLAWRSFARASMVLAIVASFFSGVRAAFLFTPVLLFLLYAMKGRVRRMLGALGIAGIAVALVSAGLSFSNLTLTDIASYTSGLTARYSHDNGSSYIFRYFSVMGNGVGSGTNATRYVVETNDLMPESYYAKTIYELGVPGAVSVVLLLTTPIVLGFRDLPRLRAPATRAFCIGVVALAITLLGYSFKGSFLDFDPMNVLFWFLIGIASQLPALERVRAGGRLASSVPGTIWEAAPLRAS